MWDRSRRVALALTLVLVAGCTPAAPPQTPQPSPSPATSSAAPIPDPTPPTPSPAAPETTSTSEPSPTATPTLPLARFSYEDAIRERVYVVSERDDNADGAPDRYPLDIIRPRGATDVPVIMEQSPYWDTLGRGLLSQLRERGEDGTATVFPMWYDNYFVPRGYAFVMLDEAGFGDSEGCIGDLGPESRAAAVAALDFLSGRAQGEAPDGTPVAADWSSGRVAMVGKSADAALGLQAASTGHPALRAVVSVSGITSWEEHGTTGALPYVRYPRETREECLPFLEAQGDLTGGLVTTSDYDRDQDVRHSIDQFHAAVLFAHGQRDFNTRSGQILDLWRQLRGRGVDTELWLHQGSHTDPFDVDRDLWVHAVDVWLARHLLGDTPPAAGQDVHVQMADGSWFEGADLPQPEALLHYALTADGMGPGTDGGVPEAPVGTVVDDPSFDYTEFLQPETSETRVVFRSAPLEADVSLLGPAKVRLWVRPAEVQTGVVVSLVEVGPNARPDLAAGLVGQDVARGPEECLGGGTAADTGCFPEGSLDAPQGDLTLVAIGGHGISRASWLDDSAEVRVGQWVQVEVPMTWVAHDANAGNSLAVVVTASDPFFRGWTAIEPLDVGPGSIELPLR